MSSPAEMAERHGRMLAELSELGCALARDLQSRALQAETPQEAAQLAEAFHRISRSVRQSLALEAKLQRDAARDLREQREVAARQTEVRRAARKAQLKTRIERLIWDEVEEPDIASEMFHDVAHFIEREAESERFLDEPVEAQIARLREAMGVDEDWDIDEADGDLAEEDAAEDGANDASPADPPAKGPSNPPGSPDDYWFNSA